MSVALVTRMTTADGREHLGRHPTRRIHKLAFATARGIGWHVIPSTQPPSEGCRFIRHMQNARNRTQGFGVDSDVALAKGLRLVPT